MNLLEFQFATFECVRCTLMMKYSSLTALFMGLVGFLNAQIVSISPAFPTENDLVTITFDASQGSGGLIGESQVYGHFGVITSASSSNTDWRHVVGNWGVADPTTAMTNIGNNKHTFTYDIRSFHSVPGSETVLRLSMVFRNADGSKEGKTAGGGDIFIDLFNAGFQSQFQKPQEDLLIRDTSVVTDVEVVTSSAASIELYVDTTLVASVSNSSSLSHQVSFNQAGGHIIHYMATDGLETRRDTFKYLARAGAKIQNPSATYDDGGELHQRFNCGISTLCSLQEFRVLNWRVQQLDTKRGLRNVAHYFRRSILD